MRNATRPALSSLMTIALLLLSTAPTEAHTPLMGVVQMELAEEQVVVRMRVDAIGLGQFLQLDRDGDEITSSQELERSRVVVERYLAAQIELITDGVPCAPIEFSRMSPDGDEPSYVEFTGTVQCPQQMGIVEISYRVLFEQDRRYMHYAEIITPVGSMQGSFHIGRPSVTARVADLPPQTGAESEPEGTGEGEVVWGEVAEDGGSETLSTVLNRIAIFIRLGIEHIFIGLDHILFILGLTIAAQNLRRLAMIVTSFTLAHSITLALASLELINIPIQLAEIAIALSVAYVGIENLVREPTRRALLAFGFGLIHGIGFSSVLGDLLGGMEMTTGHRVQLLVGFNVGVEIGQLAIVCAVFPLVAWLRRRGDHRKLVLPASLIIAGFGLFWFFQRAL